MTEEERWSLDKVADKVADVVGLSNRIGPQLKFGGCIQVCIIAVMGQRLSAEQVLRIDIMALMT